MRVIYFNTIGSGRKKLSLFNLYYLYGISKTDGIQKLLSLLSVISKEYKITKTSSQTKTRASLSPSHTHTRTHKKERKRKFFFYPPQMLERKVKEEETISGAWLQRNSSCSSWANERSTLSMHETARTCVQTQLYTNTHSHTTIHMYVRTCSTIYDSP